MDTTAIVLCSTKLLKFRIQTQGMSTTNVLWVQTFPQELNRPHAFWMQTKTKAFTHWERKREWTETCNQWNFFVAKIFRPCGRIIHTFNRHHHWWLSTRCAVPCKVFSSRIMGRVWNKGNCASQRKKADGNLLSGNTFICAQLTTESCRIQQLYLLTLSFQYINPLHALPNNVSPNLFPLIFCTAGFDWNRNSLHRFPIWLRTHKQSKKTTETLLGGWWLIPGWA